MVYGQLHSDNLYYSELVNISACYLLEDEFKRGKLVRIVENQKETMFEVLSEKKGEGEIRIWVETPALLKSVRKDQ